MTEDKFALVEFEGAKLLTIFDGETVRVAIKHVCEALGIDWRSQHAKITGDQVLSKGMVLTTIPSERGPQETATLPIDLMHGWLFKLNPERVGEEARPRVIAFQKECYRVLHDYWVKGAAINPRLNGRTGLAALPPVREVITLVEALKSERIPRVQALYYEMLDQQLRSRGVATPALEDFHPIDQTDSLVAESFFAALLELQARGATFDFHRNPALLSVSLPMLRVQFGMTRIECPPDRALWKALPKHPAYVTTGNVNCSDGRVRRCWTFNRARVSGIAPV